MPHTRRMRVEHFEGPLISPHDDGYDEARKIWNGDIDRRPALIARCTNAEDVAAALRFARTHDLDLTVRGGGHGVAGSAVSDGAVMLDLSLMRAVEVNAAASLARAGAGALWGDLDSATQQVGMATVGGIVTHTGIAGLTLGGGIGWLSRLHGLTVDNLLEAEVVTADGRRITASEREHDDLFWALRGGGGNFGVVTSFTYRLHPRADVLAGPIVWPIEAATEVLLAHEKLMADAPDELMTIMLLRRVPPTDLYPADLHGRHACIIIACWLGDPEEGDEALRPLRSIGSPLADLAVRKSYVEHQRMLDSGVPHGLGYYWKTALFDSLDEDLADALTRQSSLVQGRSYNILFHLGGAVARVPESATAYPHRRARYNLNINAVWSLDDDLEEVERHRSWVRGQHAAVAGRGVGAYVNFVDRESPTRAEAMFGPATYARLTAVKARYDPDNIFHHNVNIEPAPLARR